MDANRRAAVFFIIIGYWPSLSASNANDFGLSELFKRGDNNCSFLDFTELGMSDPWTLDLDFSDLDLDISLLSGQDDSSLNISVLNKSCEVMDNPSFSNVLSVGSFSGGSSHVPIEQGALEIVNKNGSFFINEEPHLINVKDRICALCKEEYCLAEIDKHAIECNAKYQKSYEKSIQQEANMKKISLDNELRDVPATVAAIARNPCLLCGFLVNKKGLGMHMRRHRKEEVLLQKNQGEKVGLNSKINGTKDTLRSLLLQKASTGTNSTAHNNVNKKHTFS